ncbi:unnamed protein product [Urochloa decumbens]|uniref:DUF6598 domain-containing protein n=1 Tax=Urochloa decumbens TaxID=240449 RepID=A0ABC9B5W0_9POAL
MAQKIAPVQEVTFDMKSGSYGAFIETLRGALAGAKPTMIAPPSSKVQRPVLAKETGEDVQPPRWIHVKLSGENGVAPKVAIRSDNAYIRGFTNSKGTWFQLSKTGTKVNLVSDKPVMLGFNDHYQTLVGGIDNLPKLNLTKSSTAKAAGKLWDHTQKALSDDDDEDDATILRNDELKKAVATLCVALCEAVRFTPVYDAINKGWGKDQVSITTKEVGFIKQWGDLSKQLLKWKSDGYKGDADLFKQFSSIGISNGAQALDAVQLVKLIVRSYSLLAWLKYAELPRHGRYMAEVFTVRVPASAGGGDRPPPCGTISFHGGHCCSDFIYSSSPAEEPNPSPSWDSQGNIILTGPSVATSAYGPVVFNLDLHDGSRGSSSQQGEAADEDGKARRILCDAVDDEFSNYDRTIVETISTGYGPADVIYAVLSNAVEGRVAVKLIRQVGGDAITAAAILGRITARSKLFDVGCVLFYNERGDKDDVRVRPGELIPLARQALAVPLHMPLTVELDLRCSSGDEIARGGLEFNPTIDGQRTQRLVGVNGAELEVTISWSDYPW